MSEWRSRKDCVALLALKMDGKSQKTTHVGRLWKLKKARGCILHPEGLQKKHSPADTFVTASETSF